MEKKRKMQLKKESNMMTDGRSVLRNRLIAWVAPQVKEADEPDYP